jgi:hypothetical protein
VFFHFILFFYLIQMIVSTCLFRFLHTGTYDILRSAEGESVLMSDWRDFRTRRGSLSINVHELTDEVGLSVFVG